MEGAQKKTARNFQLITGSLLRSQYLVILTSQKQSKEIENRDTDKYDDRLQDSGVEQNN